MIDRVGEWRVLAIIAAIVFIVQLIVIPAPNFYGEPYLVAKNIIAGKGFVFTYPITQVGGLTCFITPLYTWIATAILYLGLTERGLQIWNLLVLMASWFVVYSIFRSLVSRSVGVLLFTALAFYGPLWILSYSLEPNSLNILLIVLTIACLYKLSQAATRSRWIQLGILIGIQMLVRPDILIGISLFAIWLLWTERKQWLTYAKGLIAAFAIALLIVSPWTIRNYVAFHRFVLVSANAGMNLYVGNNWVATGEFSEEPPTTESRAEFATIQEFSKTHDQIEIDNYRLQLAKEWMIAHPMDVIVLDLKKIQYHWFGRPIMGEEFHYKYQALASAFKVATVLMIGLGFFALFQLPDKKLRSLLLVLFAYSTVVSTIFFVQSRHRLIKVDPFLVPLAVIGMANIVSYVKARRISSLATDSHSTAISQA